MANRYEIRNGKYGMYFRDTDIHADLPLDTVLELLNHSQKLIGQLEADSIEKDTLIKELYNRDSVVFFIDGTHKTKKYKIDELPLYDESAILENEEECDCSLNESTAHCEGDCQRFEESSVTGWEIV